MQQNSNNSTMKNMDTTKKIGLIRVTISSEHYSVNLDFDIAEVIPKLQNVSGKRQTNDRILFMKYETVSLKRQPQQEIYTTATK